MISLIKGCELERNYIECWLRAGKTLSNTSQRTALLVVCDPPAVISMARCTNHAPQIHKRGFHLGVSGHELAPSDDIHSCTLQADDSLRGVQSVQIEAVVAAESSRKSREPRALATRSGQTSIAVSEERVVAHSKRERMSIRTDLEV